MKNKFRPSLGAQRSRNMPIRFDVKVVAWLRHVAIQESQKRGKSVGWSELVRESVLQRFPIPDNFDLNKIRHLEPGPFSGGEE